jgi:hypothetical protein
LAVHGLVWWLRAVQPDEMAASRREALVVSALDTDRSGAVDHPDEVAGAPCDAVRLLGADGVWPGFAASVTDAAAARLRVCSGQPATPSTPTVALEALRSLPGARTGWLRTARAVLISAYDTDRSGALDTTTEVAQVPCEMWASLDRLSMGFFGRSLRVSMGVDEGASWSGHMLGVRGAVRPSFGAALVRCDVDRPAKVQQVPRSDVWPLARAMLLRAADADGSGVVDPREVGLAPCTLWAELVELIPAAPDLRWMEVGVAPAASELLTERLAACQLQQGVMLVPEAERLSMMVSTATSSNWWHLAALTLRDGYDADADGWLGVQEVRRVPCSVWTVLALDIGEAWHRPMAQVLGRGRAWMGDALALEASAARAVGRRLEACAVADVVSR